VSPKNRCPEKRGRLNEVHAYKQTFTRIRDAALTPAATRIHLDTLTNTLE
jgi:hypothetical protein